jgi:hypothetical protein
MFFYILAHPHQRTGLRQTSNPPHPLARSAPVRCAVRRSLARLRHFFPAKSAGEKRLGAWALPPHPGARAKTSRCSAATW